MGALLGAVGEIWAIEFPTVRFPFTLSRGVGFLAWIWREAHLSLVRLAGHRLVLLLGIFSEIAFAKGFSFTPITLRRIERFKSIKRGYYSLVVILALAAVASSTIFWSATKP